MIDNVMAHPPPPPGPPPEEEAFRLEIYHFFRRSVRREDGGYVYARQYIYRSAWYRSQLEACMLQAAIKTFLQKLGMLGLIESFTYWRIQKMSDVQRAIARAQGGDQGAERLQPDCNPRIKWNPRIKVRLLISLKNSKNFDNDNNELVVANLGSSVMVDH